MNRDFVEMLSALSAAQADYLIVGAHALAAHGIVRATGDLDIWIRPSRENADRVWQALHQFGAPLDQITREELASDDVVFQIGVAPHRIDLLTSITAVQFAEAWTARTLIDMEGLSVPIISREHMIQNKMSTGRPRDVADVAELKKQDQNR